jgi:hypothetical protein
VGYITNVRYAAHVFRERLAHRYARTRRAIPCLLLITQELLSIPHAITSYRSLCSFRSAVSRHPFGLPFFFVVFTGSFLRSLFGHFFALEQFFVIYGIINTSLTSSHHQNLLSTRHETVKTRQHTKNGQKWLFLRVSKKGLKMAVFGLFLTSSKNDVFLTSTHHQHIKK